MFAAGTFTPSLADVYIVPMFFKAMSFGVAVDESAYPFICKVVKQCVEMSAFEKAKPENQPDYISAS